MDKKTATLTLMLPPAAAGGTFAISRLDSVIVAANVKSVTFENLEIRYARGGGVLVTDSTGFLIKGCTVSQVHKQSSKQCWRTPPARGLVLLEESSSCL